jgi:hypothetical protein
MPHTERGGEVPRVLLYPRPTYDGLTSPVPGGGTRREMAGKSPDATCLMEARASHYHTPARRRLPKHRTRGGTVIHEN